MQPSDFQPFRNMIVGMGKMYEREVDEPMLDAYWHALREWDIGEFLAAAGQLMRTSKFMPRPADFTELRKAGRATAAEAWEQARQFARSLYSPQGYRDGEMGHYAIDTAVRAIGGYPAIAMCDTDKLHFLERQFSDRFEELRDVEDAREAVPALMGPERFGSTLRIRTGGPKALGDLLPKLEKH